MFVLSHPTGNTFVRATARMLEARGWLHAFYTTIVAPDPAVLRLMPGRWRRRLGSRAYDEIPRGRLHARPVREAVRLCASASGLRPLTRRGAVASIDAVYLDLDRHVARQLERMPRGAGVRGVYAYEDGAESSFRSARHLGIACIYELPIAHWRTARELLLQEAERLPAWRSTLGGLDDPPEKLDRKDRELALADAIVVPSQFVLDSLPSALRHKRCVVAPFGSPSLSDAEQADDRQSGKLRVLFAGALSQRKGLADVFAAMRLLKRTDIELVVMGAPVESMAFYRQQYSAFSYERPRSHSDVLALMRTCDVLVLPSIVEGRALVQQEALACGLPLIVTPNAGGDDLVSEGRNGFVVPIRSPEAIAGRLAWFADHRAALPEIRREARRTSALYPWSSYEEHVCRALAEATAA